MSAELFRARLGRARVHPNDRTWMPKWLDEYAGRQDQRGGDLPRIDQETVLGFLRSLRDRGSPA
ncbi:MAG: hypothetical protein ACQESR_29200 [Planctomycetota bacterium]